MKTLITGKNNPWQKIYISFDTLFDINSSFSAWSKIFRFKPVIILALADTNLTRSTTWSNLLILAVPLQKVVLLSTSLSVVWIWLRFCFISSFLAFFCYNSFLAASSLALDSFCNQISFYSLLWLNKSFYHAISDFFITSSLEKIINSLIKLSALTNTWNI